jgi:hypothetical protein
MFFLLVPQIIVLIPMFGLLLVLVILLVIILLIPLALLMTLVPLLTVLVGHMEALAMVVVELEQLSSDQGIKVVLPLAVIVGD